MNILKRFLEQIFTPEEVEATPENLQKWEGRAPGWIIPRNHCGMEEPFGKYGILRKLAGRKRNFGRCPHCRKWSWFAIFKNRLNNNSASIQTAIRTPLINHSSIL